MTDQLGLDEMAYALLFLGVGIGLLNQVRDVPEWLLVFAGGGMAAMGLLAVAARTYRELTGGPNPPAQLEELSENE